MNIQLIPFICLLALLVVSDAQPGQPDDKDDKMDTPTDGGGSENCPAADQIVDGDPCGDFIPAGSQEASCFVGDTGEQCNCPGQETPDPVWECRNVADDLDEETDPVATPVAAPTDSMMPTSADVPDNEVTPAPTTSDNTDSENCPPANQIVNGNPCSDFIPAGSQEASCFVGDTGEQCNCPGQETPDPVWECRDVSNPEEPEEPPQKCAGKPCDPTLEDQCNCRAGLECRQRQPGLYQCSQVSRIGRNRISASEQFGGAAGRDRRQRLGLLSF